MTDSIPSQGSDMADNTPNQPPGVSGNIGPSTSQVPSTSTGSTRSKLRTKIKGLFSVSKTPSERPTTPTPLPIKASNTTKRQGIGNDASDVLTPVKLTSKRAEKVPQDPAETNDKKIALLDLSIGAINALRDVSQITGVAMNQSNPVGQVLEKVAAVLGTLKQMMENRRAWETILITLDNHQKVFNQQLTRLKKENLDADSTSPFLDPVKQYSTALEEILAGIIKESGLDDKDATRGGKWETVKNFSSRFINAGSEQGKIQAYDRQVSDAMNDLKVSLVLYISDKVQEIGNRLVSNEEENMLAKLKITDLECGSLSRGCMEGTRQDILEKIKEWTKDLEAPNILWLKGHPGVGKSAIATNMVEYLRTSGRLGSGFFFHRQNATIMTTSLLWCTVAYDLARKYPTIRKHIIAALKAHELGPTTVNVDKVFLHLIYEPMVESETIAEDSLPIVVVDALDECGGLDSRRREHRRGLMQTLKIWSRLPSKFKLIVTSRSEIDIERVFSAINHRLVEILAGQTVEPQSSKDIQIFLTHQLQVQVMNDYEESLPPNYGTQVAEDLAERAAGLFIWAETVINFMSLGHPQRRLEQVLKGSGTGDMNALYSQILRSSFGQASREEIDNFCAVVGTIILAKVPLSVLSLQQLLSLDELAVRVVCNGLRSVLDSRDVLRFHHQSFVDFLMDPERSPHQFRFERNRESQNLTLACLRVMKNVLRFNICDMPSSYLRNSDVPDLEARVEKCIPPYVSYSSRFWANHLAETVFDIEVFECLQHFMQDQFLFWLEILSLTKRINIASSMLLLLVDWIKAGQRDDAMARDMRKFVAAFAVVISQSVPHLYLSVLPFAPQQTPVSKQYMPLYPQTLRVQDGGRHVWQPIHSVFEGHSTKVTSVAFSPNSKHIVSGSWDHTIRVWDAETGEVSGGPLEGHTSRVESVAFSPDGKKIASGSWDKTIRVWDAETGEKLGDPLGGHTGFVISVAFSHDGRHIVSGSKDKTIRMWDVETGDVSGGALEGHTDSVQSVAFSPDGKRLASGSWDQTILVWDAESGEALGHPLEGHTSRVESVAFSPDGKRIASGSLDKTIRVWDAETGEKLGGLLEGHTGFVFSVAFSHDGKHIVSGSRDKTIRLWDVETGRMLGAPLEGHTSEVMSVALSHDSKIVVSGSADKTIRVWDVETGDASAAALEGHTDSVTSVAFSPDGKRLASGSRDITIRLWDAETGETLGEPLEGHTDAVMSVAFSPDGKIVASGSGDGAIRMWDADTGKALGQPLEGHTGSVGSIAFSPDGKYVVSGSEDKTVRLWDAETREAVRDGEPGRELGSHDNSVTPVAFSSRAKIATSGSDGLTIEVWDAETGKAWLSLKGHTGFVYAIAFSHDGKYIASGSRDKTIRLWDAETGEPLTGALEGHTNEVLSVAFSPDDRYIISASRDNTIRLWDAETHVTLGGALEGHVGLVYSVAFSPDGKHIASGSSDRTIRVWDMMLCDDRNTSLFNTSSRMHEGWILDSNSRRLFWVPPWLRTGLMRPGNTLLMGRVIPVQLNLENFEHGESWSYCRGSQPSSS